MYSFAWLFSSGDLKISNYTTSSSKINKSFDKLELNVSSLIPLQIKEFIRLLLVDEDLVDGISVQIGA